MLLPFVLWSVLVIVVYSAAVLKCQGVVEAVAIHSVVNNMGARIMRAVFYSQELAAAENAQQIVTRRASLRNVIKLVEDAWFTLQLGDDAYKAAGDDCENFPLVKAGLSYSSPELAQIFYGSGHCHRVGENLPCPGPDDRFYKIRRTGLDTVMEQFQISLNKMVTSKLPLGLASDEVDYIYNVGGKDLLDGVVEVASAHDKLILLLFNRILLFHVALFLACVVLFIGFIVLLLGPLLKRVTKERRRIAELMSQLPLELDVEKLVLRALEVTPAGNTTDANVGNSVKPSGGKPSAPSAIEGGENGGADTTSASQWKAILALARSGSNTSLGAPGKQGRASMTSMASHGRGAVTRRSSGALRY